MVHQQVINGYVTDAVDVSASGCFAARCTDLHQRDPWDRASCEQA